MSDTLVCGMIMMLKPGHYDLLTRTVPAPRQTSNRGRQAASRNTNGPSPGAGRAQAPAPPWRAQTPLASPRGRVHSLPRPPSSSRCWAPEFSQPLLRIRSPPPRRQRASSPGSSATTTQVASPPPRKPIHTEPRRKWGSGQDAGEPGGFRGCPLWCASSLCPTSDTTRATTRSEPRTGRASSAVAGE